MRTPSWRLLTLGLAAFGLFLPSWSFAGEVILYGPGSPDAEAAAVAEETFFALTGTTEVPDGGTVNVFDLPFSARAPLWMAGDLLELPCRDPELAMIDPGAAFKEGAQLVEDLEYERGLLVLEQGIQALPCTASSIRQKTLINLHFFAGIAQSEIGEEAKARRAFSAALAIDIDTPWNTNFAPRLQAIWNRSREDLLQRGRVRIVVDTGHSGIRALEIDGTSMPSEGLSEFFLQPGRHLIRYRDSKDESHAALVDVSGTSGALVSREALHRSILTLPKGSNDNPAVTLALSSLVRDRGADTAFVVALDESGQPGSAFRWELSSNTVTPQAIDEGTRDKIAKALHRRSRSTARLGAGRGPPKPGRFGLIGAGGVLVNGDHVLAAAGLRADVRLIEGLEVGLGVTLATTETDFFRVLLPVLSIEARYRRMRGPLHPYVGARGLIGFSSSESDLLDTENYVIGGAAGVVGLEVTPRTDKGFTVYVDVGAGAISKGGDPSTPRFHLTATGGIGVRL